MLFTSDVNRNKCELSDAIKRVEIKYVNTDQLLLVVALILI